MTLNCAEVFLATIICTIITIVLYIVSWYNHDEIDLNERISSEENELKEANTSNLQGLENDQPIPRGEPNETLNFDVERKPFLTAEHQPSGEIRKEKSDLCRLQDEDFRSRVSDNGSSEHSITDDYVKVEEQNFISEYDPVVHADPKIGRLHLSIRYDNERSKLIVQIVDAQGLIRPEQVYVPEMYLVFTLIGPYSTDDNDAEKHTRIVVDNAPVNWRESMAFCVTFENATKQNLYVNASNKSDPSTPRDREVCREK